MFCDELMKMHTSFRIGGLADFFVEIKTLEELKKIKKLALDNHIPFYIIGNGSNLLIRDNGIRGIVAKLNFNKLEINKDSR